MTLNIRSGDWAVLRNGEVRGPLDYDGGLDRYPFSCLSGDWAKNGEWINPFERVDGEAENDLDIIATLPCPPLERIRQLEEELRAIERHNDNPAHYDAHINKLCEEALGESK